LLVQQLVQRLDLLLHRLEQMLWLQELEQYLLELMLPEQLVQNLAEILL
jgi:hypothetical protein